MQAKHIPIPIAEAAANLLRPYVPGLDAKTLADAIRSFSGKPTATEPELYVSLQEASRRVGLHPITLRRHCEKGTMVAVKFGRNWRVAESTLKAKTI